MKLNNATEFTGPASEGWHPAELSAETGFAKTATVAATGAKVSDTAPKLKLTITLTGGDDRGKVIYDDLLTDDTYKGSGIARAKLRDLGIKEVDQDMEVPDAKLASDLTGRRVFVNLGLQQLTDKDPVTGLWTVPKFFTDKNGVTTASMKNVVNSYSLKDPGALREVLSAAMIADLKAKAKDKGAGNTASAHAEPWNQK